MIIGHFPAGYILTKLLANRLKNYSFNSNHFFLAGLIGAIIPDVDMFYFYLIDHQQHHHHTYWSHYPLLWLSLTLSSILWFQISTKKTTALLGFIFSINGFMHILLDTINGDMWWLAPFYDVSFAIITVPARYHPWWLNFILHWSFGFEILVIGWAILLLFDINYFKLGS